MTFFTIFASSTRNARRILMKNITDQWTELVKLKIQKSIPRFHTATAPRATISTLHRLLTFRDSCVLPWAESRDLRVNTISFGKLLARNWRRRTHAWESNTAVTALGCWSRFFEVVVDKLASWGLDHASAIRWSIVWLAFAESDTLGHINAANIVSTDANKCASSYLVLTRTLVDIWWNGLGGWQNCTALSVIAEPPWNWITPSLTNFTIDFWTNRPSEFDVNFSGFLKYSFQTWRLCPQLKPKNPGSLSEYIWCLSRAWTGMLRLRRDKEISRSLTVTAIRSRSTRSLLETKTWDLDSIYVFPLFLHFKYAGNNQSGWWIPESDEHSYMIQQENGAFDGMIQIPAW
jgi:hypothetical protein